MQTAKQKKEVIFNFFGVCYLRFALNKTQSLKPGELQELEQMLKDF